MYILYLYLCIFIDRLRIYIYVYIYMNIVATYRFGRSWGGKHNRTPTDTLLEAWLFLKYIYIYTCICTPQNFTDRILYPATLL